MLLKRSPWQGGQTRSLVRTCPLRYNRQVDRGGQSVSATEFAGLTGLSRERLRTWERRFGFPQPIRVGQGPRRYALADAARVVAVRRAAQQGVPLAEAIAAAAEPAPDGEPRTPAAATLAVAVGVAPTPVVLVSGPEPLRVVYVNAAVRSLPDALAPGQRLGALPWFLGSDLERTLHALFAGDVATLECQHPMWGAERGVERSIAYRLPPAPREPPTVALVGVDRAQERRAREQLEALQRELASARASDRRRGRWLALAARLAERFQRDAGTTLLPTVTSTVGLGLGALDAGIAVYLAGELALTDASHGLLTPHRVTVTGFDDLATLLHAGTPGWLDSATGAAFGVAPDLHSLAVPIVVVGEPLGILLLVFDEPAELDADATRLLTVVSAGIGFTLLRDRLVASGRAPAQSS